MSEIVKRLYAATTETISAESYPGYPTARLVIENAHELEDLTLPDGPWTTTVTTFPSIEEQHSLQERGYELDTYGRPLHPWLRDMLSNPEVGVVTGTGEYWHWGPNHTADPIILSTDHVPKVLLIKRQDTGKWALPGGYVDKGENGIEAARRELFEEAGVIIAPDQGTEVYTGVVADLRTTAHAWAETTATLWYVDATPPVIGSDDAVEAGWFSSDQLPGELHGSHAVLIKKALDTQRPPSATHIISLPAESYKQADGGHMAYRRLIARHKDGSETFIKSHDKNAFTDPIREVHSRLYLHKEHHVYDHLLKNGFVHIPDLVKLHDENTLVMQALSETEGWKWRAPGQDIEPYVRSVFDAIDALNHLPLPKDFKDAEVPVTRTLVQEGWDILSNGSVGNIRNKNLRWQARIRPEFRTAADLLIDDISGIRKDFYSSPPVEQTHLCHHDMRQANIAWHPDHGTRLVDWSWTGAGGKNSDTTMLLIDLHKSGHDVSRYMQRFDTQHARSLMGFWLAHSLMPAYGGDSVRFHQFVSAISAYDLLTKYR